MTSAAVEALRSPDGIKVRMAELAEIFFELGLSMEAVDGMFGKTYCEVVLRSLDHDEKHARDYLDLSKYWFTLRRIGKTTL